MTDASIDQLVSQAQARVQPLAQAGDWAGVARIVGPLTRAAPNSAVAWLMQSHAFAKMGRFAEACDSAQKAFSLQSPTPDDLVYVARLAMKAQDFDRADRALSEAEDIAGDHPSTLAARALYLTYLGRNDEAERYCLASIKADPLRIDAWPQLSMLRGGALSPEQEGLLKPLLENPETPAPVRKTAGFVLAHSLDARGETDAAFIEYARANALSRIQNRQEGYAFDTAGSEAWTRHIMKVFRGARGNGPAGANAGSGDDIVRPLFIVGLPRSGSTLIESVLAAHSKVTAGGEAEMLPRMFSTWLKQTARSPRAMLTDAERREFAAHYAAGVGMASKGAVVTDKNLLNIEAVGFIAALFPESKIIHIRRAPMEAGLGIFRQNLMRFWTWTTSLEDIGVRMGQVARLARHWERCYPERFVTVQYETFADDFPNEARRLFEFCGLDFETQCLDFHKAGGFVSTTSSAQVREPMKKRSGKAQAYAAHLGPLRTALERARINLQTGAFEG